MSELALGALAILVGVAWAELKDWMPWLALRIVRAAVRRLPFEQRERMDEELAAEIKAMPGKLMPFLSACSIWWGFSKQHLREHADAQILDRIGAALAVVFMSPALAIVQLLVKLSYGGPATYKLRRVGRNGKEFHLLRFLTFEVVEGEVSINSGGAFLRKTGLYRLPELFNVLRGDIRLFGPRALSVKEVKLLGRSVDEPLKVRPGLFENWEQAIDLFLRGSRSR